MNPAKSAEVIRVGPIEVRFRLEASQTGGQLTMFDFRVPARAQVPVPHSHVAYDETIYGLDGELAWTFAGRQVSVGPGDVLFIPRGAVHQFTNGIATDARQLAVITPGILGPEYFRELAAVLQAGGPPDLAQIRAIMERHGLRPVLPSAPAS